MNISDRLLLAVDLAGIFFALEGAMAVREGNLDFVRAMVLSFAMASAGGDYSRSIDWCKFCM